MTSIVVWSVLGLLAGCGYLALARSDSAKGERRILANGLIVAAVVYVGFGVVSGDSIWIGIEVAGAWRPDGAPA